MASQDIFASAKGGPSPAVRTAIAEAVAHMGGGRFDQAAAALAANGGAALNTPVGQNIIGDIHLKSGRPADALKAFEAAIKLAPQMPEAHCNRGVALQELGRLEDALAAENRALRYRPNYATAHYNRGNILKTLMRFDEAIGAYDKAVRANPKLAEAWLNRGLANLARGRPLDALGDFGRALALRPRYAEAQVGRAGAFRDLGDAAQSFAAIEAAVAIDPDNVDAAIIRCGALVAAERYEDALAAADALIARDPENGRAHAERSLALRKLERFDEALAAADEAVRLSPQDNEAHTTRAIVLTEMDRLEEAAGALATARRLGANGAAFHHSLALTEAALGSLDAAEASFQSAIALKPDDPTNHYHHSFLLLSRGRYEEGWAEHEWRLKMPEQGHIDKQALAPLWQGEDLTGKTILIYNEQGHGDSIQFVRYVPLVAAKGGKVTLVVQEALRRLFEANFPEIDVTASLGMRTNFDYQAPLMSLAFVFGTREDTIPSAVPYLVAEAKRIAKWLERIGSGGFKVGIVWQGNPKYRRDRDRSVKLPAFAPLAAIPGVRLISLQAQVGTDQLKALPDGLRVETLGEEIVANPDGFREMAAAMMAMDMMVTTDTGPAHLAGALGVPIFVALRDRPDWRWLLEGEASPWYPTMRLFRQKQAKDWARVFAEVAAAVRDKAAARV